MPVARKGWEGKEMGKKGRRKRESSPRGSDGPAFSSEAGVILSRLSSLGLYLILPWARGSLPLAAGMSSSEAAFFSGGHPGAEPVVLRG